ncbi:RluA family pseudouridine synthase [Fulvivirga sp. M361]|uniref:RluA family pseudouridine synthase n=1 Tax=Fulvivirga sp. M361 TaxID=2594266 RepID=UPI00117B07DF|nr:RluA family pseudouridine synthase [Fulvivirga sp. M361]TRX56229.1 RluA family pseudouridine synthase [Fulvivirga sp. M361]
MARKIRFEDLVLWEDDDYVLINKPPFISTLEDRNSPMNILEMARQVIPDAQVGHRLDKETSGVLALAKNAEAYRHLSVQFEQRKVNKEYHALCDGIHDFKDFTVTDKILKLSNGSVRIDRAGKEARTIFNTLHAYKLHSLIRCQPITGRMHQIRIHLANNGASITGDPLYGGKPFYLSSIKRNYNLGKWEEELPLIKRHALHAHALSFKDLSGNEVAVKAEYPKDFRVVVKQLDKNV